MSDITPNIVEYIHERMTTEAAYLAGPMSDDDWVNPEYVRGMVELIATITVQDLNDYDECRGRTEAKISERRRALDN